MRISLPFTLIILSFLLAACGGLRQPASDAQPEPFSLTSEPPLQPTTSSMAIASRSVPETTVAAGSLQSNAWQWISFTSPVEQYTIDNPQNYLITFKDGETLEIKADCNKARGAYTSDSSALKIEIGPMTKAACPQGSKSDLLIKHLGYLAGYFFKNGHLFIDLFADGGTLEFAPVD